uniref:Uncharacterized protein n=1 Tax=Arundo donax TaxID=35708 RepID=A0A0A9FI55_ARUDO
MLFSLKANSIVFMEASTASDANPSSAKFFKVCITNSSTF